MNPIGWCDITINPITGCRNHCEYCYAERFAKRLAGRYGYPADDPFQPTFHQDKLDEILELRGEGKRVFLSSMGDWFSEGVPAIWVLRILDAVNEVPQHHFLVLTKRPDRILDTLRNRDLPPNLWLGVSVTRQADLWRIDMLKRHILPTTKRFVSFEPLHGQIDPDLTGIDWVIIGQETGNRKGKAFSKRSWIDAICDQANFESIPVYLKQGLCGPRIDGAYCSREEFPEGLQ